MLNSTSKKDLAVFYGMHAQIPAILRAAGYGAGGLVSGLISGGIGIAYLTFNSL
jgi:hypothetical protein